MWEVRSSIHGCQQQSVCSRTWSYDRQSLTVSCANRDAASISNKRKSITTPSTLEWDDNMKTRKPVRQVQIMHGPGHRVKPMIPPSGSHSYSPASTKKDRNLDQSSSAPGNQITYKARSFRKRFRRLIMLMYSLRCAALLLVQVFTIK